VGDVYLVLDSASASYCTSLAPFSVRFFFFVEIVTLRKHFCRILARRAKTNKLWREGNFFVHIFALIASLIFFRGRAHSTQKKCAREGRETNNKFLYDITPLSSALVVPFSLLTTKK
jgi:hypothetical protein